MKNYSEFINEEVGQLMVEPYSYKKERNRL